MSIRTRTSGIMTMIAPTPTTTLTPIQILIAGLATDGVTAILDRLWVFAQATEALALVDVIAGATATAVNSPVFTPNVGYTSTSGPVGAYVDSGYNPNVDATHFALGSAMACAWSLTSTQDNRGVVGMAANDTQPTIYPRYIDDHAYSRLNSGTELGVASTDGTGFWHTDRDGLNSVVLYKNGSSIVSNTYAATAITNNILRFGYDASGGWAGTFAAGGFGGSLNSTLAAALYNRLRTYMTAVGVP